MFNDDENKSICALPWIHQVIGTHGELRMCCFMNREHTNGHVSNFREEWNSKMMRSARTAMIAGKPVAACHICMNKEKSGQESSRQTYNARFLNRKDVLHRITKSLTQDMYVSEPPLFVEVRFGNLCNLMCKMCNGSFSSQIMKDASRLKIIDEQGFSDYISNEDRYVGLSYDWYEHEESWEFIDQIIPHLEEIHIAGGEPMLIAENQAFLERCVKLGCADRIAVSMVTNATTVNDKFLAITNKFRYFGITLSIDSVGSGYEYVRYPGNWSKVRANIIKILSESKSVVSYNLLVQAYNILDLPVILDELIGLHKSYSTNGRRRPLKITSLSFPKMFVTNSLPRSVRMLALARIVQWELDNPEDADYYISRGGLNMVKTQLVRYEGPAEKRLLDYSRFVDQNKKLSLQESLPELYDLLLADAS